MCVLAPVPRPYGKRMAKCPTRVGTALGGTENVSVILT